jgi:predicted lipoprotein with Yx(FWY)xxD motif
MIRDAPPSTRRRALANALVVVPCIAVAGALAACSGSGSASPSTTHGLTTKSQVVLYVMPTNVGRIVTLPYGSPVYVNITEHPGSAPACTGSCTKDWAPVVTRQAPGAADGVDGSMVSTVDYNGVKQVTYAGHRLYYYNVHRVPLVATAEGSEGVWYAILPSGKVLRE